MSIEILTCRAHGYYAVSIDGSRVTADKCCGSWTVLRGWPAAKVVCGPVGDTRDPGSSLCVLPPGHAGPHQTPGLVPAREHDGIPLATDAEIRARDIALAEVIRLLSETAAAGTTTNLTRTGGAFNKVLMAIDALMADSDALLREVAREVRAETVLDLRFRDVPPSDDRLDKIIRDVLARRKR